MADILGDAFARFSQQIKGLGGAIAISRANARVSDIRANVEDETERRKQLQGVASGLASSLAISGGFSGSQISGLTESITGPKAPFAQSALQVVLNADEFTEAQVARAEKLLESEKKIKDPLKTERQKLELREEFKKRAEKRKPPSSNQFEAALFATRLGQADKVFKKLKKKGFDPTGVGAEAQRFIPDIAERFKTSEFKQQEQAERNFVNAVLRRESGAAIAQSEFDSAEKQYFPRAGDSEEVVRQKIENRAAAIAALEAESGKALPIVKKRLGARGGLLQKEEIPIVGRTELSPTGGATRVSPIDQIPGLRRRR